VFNLYSLSILCLSALTSFLLTPFFIDVFIRGESLEKNYKGNMVPQGIGIIFPLFTFIWYSLYLVVYKTISTSSILILFAFFAASFLGFIDDTLGTRDVLGFKGHFKSLFKGRLTTGALKAITGLLIAFLVSVFFSKNFGEMAINTLIIALSTNFINLLDLRPGRAIKFYILFAFTPLIGLVLSSNVKQISIFIPLFGAILGYMPYDLKAKSMMGDAGSNVLGISMGILAVLSFPFSIQILMLVFLVSIHAFAERYSISEVINNNSVLRFLDNLGRS